MSQSVDLTGCDREPIHIPGSIQPHGVMLVVDRKDHSVAYAAGDVAGLLGVVDWQGAHLDQVIGQDLAATVLAQSDAPSGFAGQLRREGRVFDVSSHQSAEWRIVELEPGPDVPVSAAALMGALNAAGSAFERATNLESLCQRAAVECRRLTGFDRVMIYRFIDEGAGAVLAEDKVDGLPSFLHHHFPGSDIPRQARALYIRNLVRVIPDVAYEPAPLRPDWTADAPLDMSDAVLRSVSPVHMQYMRNMGIAATASVSIVKDGVLWGLIACHHRTPRGMSYDLRAACATLGGGLARQIRAKEDAELYRERIRLRSFEDKLLSDLGAEISLDQAVSQHMPDLARVLRSDGAATVRAGEVRVYGKAPAEMAIRRLAEWLLETSPHEPFVSASVSAVIPWMADFSVAASGLMATVVSADEPFVLLWFRVERVQVIEWAGNPHKAADSTPEQILSPRASFEAWSETVRGRSRRWTLPEVEAAVRLRQGLIDLRQRRQLLDLNKVLRETVAAKDGLLEQKEFLLREVNHRVQNSLQLVSSFLGLQSRSTEDEQVQAHLQDAQRRLNAVALVHRRLYRSDQIEIVDLARYIEELIGDVRESIGEEWEDHISLDLAPVMISTDRAVTLGLILTELVINANKYAYDGKPGKIEISLEETGQILRLIVADHGRGKHSPGSGFGTRMMKAMVGQLRGELAYLDNGPGLRAILSAPVDS